MILVGFGCSFTEGSGLVEDPGKDYDYNTPHREQHCWLGQLASKLGATYINKAEAGGSNFSIEQILGEFIRDDFRHITEPLIIAVGWTTIDRMSWWYEESHSWTHSKQIEIELENPFKNTYKEWILHSQGSRWSGNQSLTDNAKLFVNSVCELNNIPLLQFNALGSHNNKYGYKNYYLPHCDTLDYLQEDQLIENDGHPNESGHLEIATRLHNFIKEHKIV